MPETCQEQRCAPQQREDRFGTTPRTTITGVTGRRPGVLVVTTLDDVTKHKDTVQQRGFGEGTEQKDTDEGNQEEAVEKCRMMPSVMKRRMTPTK